jgi:hypothetical protein
MKPSTTMEAAFGSVIESQLPSHGYVSLAAAEFDRERAIFPEVVLEFVVEHFHAVSCHKIGGRAKAMVVAGSRLEAVRYKQSFDTYIAKKGYPIKSQVAFSGTVQDDNQCNKQPHTRSYDHAWFSNDPPAQTLITRESPEAPTPGNEPIAIDSRDTNHHHPPCPATHCRP